MAGWVAAITVAAVAAAGIGYGETRLARSDPPSARPSVTADGPLAAATRSPASSRVPVAPAARAAAVAAALRAPSTAAGLGGRLRGEVIDVAAGTTVYGSGADAPAAPASTAKLLTAAAVLTTRGPDYRIPTSVVAGSGGAVVLVGHGDPTLSGAGSGPTAYPDAARLRDLASAVRRAGVRPTRVVVDDSAFSGPAVSPAWAREDVPSDYGAAITATMTDGGRATPSAVVRSAAPDLAAGAELAALLGRSGLPVGRGAAPAGARVLGTVRSAPVSTLVDQMLMQSDNVIAECLGRQVAMVRGQPTTFAGAAAAIRATVRTLGVDPGTGMRDASGLAAADRLSARTLGRLLAVVATRRGPLGDIVAGLPVAGWSGSLVDRYVAGSARAAAGLLRAKTGTLTGVSALAGLVHDRAGRLLAFAFIADRTASTPAAEAALDTVAARLATCTCT